MTTKRFQTMDEEFLRGFFDVQIEAGGIIRNLNEWMRYVPAAHEALIRHAQTASFDDLPLTYGELGGKIGLFSPEYFHLKIAMILWACSEFEHEQGRPLITSIVVNRDSKQPGMGFWDVSGIPDELIRETQLEDATAAMAVDDRRLQFWVSEMRQVSNYWNPST